MTNYGTIKPRFALSFFKESQNPKRNLKTSDQTWQRMTAQMKLINNQDLDAADKAWLDVPIERDYDALRRQKDQKN